MSETAKHVLGWELWAKRTFQEHPGEADKHEVVLCETGGPPHKIICRLDFGYGSSDDEANARLIAAAPDLLMACRECLAVVDECYAASGHFRVAKGSEQRNKIVAAIAKAESGGT